jgi:hypothetical protein
MVSPISHTPGSGTTTAVAFQDSPSCGLSGEERLLALVIYTQSNRRDAAETSVNLNFEELEKLREDVKKAIEQAREAKEDEGFWSDLADFFGGDLATLATAIAAVAAVVASGGAAAAVLAVVASAASFAADHAEELGIPPEVAMGIAIGASVAGLCCGDAKGLVDIGKKVTDVAKDVKLYANIGAGLAKGAGAAFTAVAGQYEGDAIDYQADARQAEGRQEIVSVDIDEALDELASSLERQLSAANQASNIQQGTSASSSVILNNFAGAA